LGLLVVRDLLFLKAGGFFFYKDDIDYKRPDSEWEFYMVLMYLLLRDIGELCF